VLLSQGVVIPIVLSRLISGSVSEAGTMISNKMFVVVLIACYVLSASAFTLKSAAGVRRARSSLQMSAPVVKKHLKVGLFGGGTVGGGVYDLVQRYTANGRFSSVGASIEIPKICVRNIDKPRSFEVKSGTKLVTDYDAILKDDSIDTVVELMGGTTRYGS
jgi:hypothetical protein